MLCTVSTVKDTRENLDRFVRMNLASGADHMFVFLETDDPDVQELLDAEEHVTAVRTDDAYWNGARPDDLNQRQMINANVVNTLLALQPSVTWLAHLDGDECLEIDPEELAEVPADARMVRLAIREAVSTEHGSREVKAFKKKLGPKALERLTREGVLPRPANHVLLKGHLIGKSLVRPALDVTVGIHRSSGPDGVELEHHRGPGFRVLHYDCVSFDEFVRKWTSHAGAGSAAFRDERLMLLRAVERLNGDPELDETRRREGLRTLYKEHVEDDVDLLERKGVLQHWHDDWHHHRPRPFPPEAAAENAALLPLLLAADKQHFRQRRDVLASLGAMRAIASHLGPNQDALRRRLELAVDDARARAASALSDAGSRS